MHFRRSQNQLKIKIIDEPCDVRFRILVGHGEVGQILHANINIMMDNPVIRSFFSAFSTLKCENKRNFKSL